MNTPADHYKEQILKIIFQFLNKDQIDVILFGSMATEKQTQHSDIDIGIFSSHTNSTFESSLARINEAFEESNIPYKIDLINLNSAKEEFKTVALKDKIIWHQKK
jgi:predicted nucleotidyltransferase